MIAATKVHSCDNESVLVNMQDWLCQTCSSSLVASRLPLRIVTEYCHMHEVIKLTFLPGQAATHSGMYNR